MKHVIQTTQMLVQWGLNGDEDEDDVADNDDGDGDDDIALQSILNIYNDLTSIRMMVRIGGNGPEST